MRSVTELNAPRRIEQVGRHDRAVSWHTIMRQVQERGNPLVDDPERLKGVSAIGVDETAFLRACSTHPTLYATGIADLTPGRPARLLDVAEGRSGSVLGRWLDARDDAFRDTVVTASLDPFRGYATALAAKLRQRSGSLTLSMS